MSKRIATALVLGLAVIAIPATLIYKKHQQIVEAESAYETLVKTPAPTDDPEAVAERTGKLKSYSAVFNEDDSYAKYYPWAVGCIVIAIAFIVFAKALDNRETTWKL